MKRIRLALSITVILSLVAGLRCSYSMLEENLVQDIGNDLQKVLYY